MDKSILKSNLLLLLTATIWGFAFVAQRVGMDFIGPFAYNGIRFALGSLSLIPLILITKNKTPDLPIKFKALSSKMLLLSSSVLGIILFMGASLQQVGLKYTTAGKAGFITGLYVVIVPVAGIFWKQKSDLGTWTGAFLAAVGLYFLSVTEEFTVSFGDFLEIIGAFFWAAHVLIIGWLSPRTNALKLASFQFAVCSVLSLATAFIIETVTIKGIIQAAIPILYGGLCSVGIAYTLQIVAQKDAKPSHAAIILCMESPFAALGGWMILGETMTYRGFLGCGLMLSGMILSQLYPYIIRTKNRKPELAV
ncbi:EamA domain-containing protein [Desulfonema limicola]|uniref:EamA domain-containing protein n=1 Tax=Desulfonema limicola TaxID=45656 RepID=A0A975B846_9BACT|nr:DMT family transporter [Desulfonema limicola]QTA80468.1 EamA domain-containing protein [Desulfonema limicola]